MDNPLDPVIDWYRTANDSLRITQRVLNQGIPNAVTTKHSSFFSHPVPASVAKLGSAKNELDRLVVLALTAVFERTLRDHLVQIPRSAIVPGIPLVDAVRGQILLDIEYWNISSRVIEVFQSVDPNVRGLARQIIDYRNWVAHGRTIIEPAPSNVEPIRAHLHLTDFLKQASIVD
jgi:hypothetical protein